MDASEQQIKRNILERMDRCTICHHDFSPEDLTVVQRNQGFWVVAVTCSDCHNRNLVAAVLSDGDTTEARNALRKMSSANGFDIAFSSGIDAPDPTLSQDAAGPAVAASDVLEMHEFLQDFDGDFKRLFRSAAKPD